MDHFFAKNENDQLNQVREEANNLGQYSERQVEVTYTKVRYLKKAARVKLLEGHMRTDEAYDQWDHWKTTKEHHIEQANHAQIQVCESEIEEAANKISHCDGERHRYKQIIKELGELEDKVTDSIQ